MKRYPRWLIRDLIALLIVVILWVIIGLALREPYRYVIGGYFAMLIHECCDWVGDDWDQL